jgi:phage terminase small subunit
MGFNKRQVEAFYERSGYKLNEIDKTRKTMDALRSRFNKYVRLLKKVGRYEPTDEVHIETICMCEEIRLMAFTDVSINGTLVTVDKEKKVKQKNHSVSTIYQMSKLIFEVSAKLGLSVQDRHALKLDAPIDDGLDD